MLGLIPVRAVAGTLAVVTVAGLVSLAVAPAASAAPRTGETGSIIYDKGGDVYQTTPDGSQTHQVTTNGSTPTSDQTGSTGYAVPTESDNGLIAAVRNQDVAGYSLGFIWVMDRNGTVIDKFQPPQFDLLAQFPGCSGPDAQLPQGILNATISPDGKHIAYTATALGNDALCEPLSEVGSWIADIDGRNAHWLSAGTYDTADIEIGRWVSNTRLLIDRFDFGSIENFYVDLPSYTATSWSEPGDFIDQTYLQPDVANGVAVTDGYSETSADPAIRIWPTSGFNSPLGSNFCEYPSPAHPGVLHDNLNQPSLSPDGAEVVFEDYDGTVPNESDEGIYLAPAAPILASNQACAAANPSLFVQGAEDPFWTPASITAVPPDTTAPTVNLTAPAHAATMSSSVKIAWSGHDDYSGVAYYQLRSRTASYSGGFGSWSAPSQHLIGSAATASGLNGGNDYCFEVRAFDNAGNTSAWSSSRCTAVPLDDRSLSTSKGWHRDAGHAYYAGTITTTTVKGATLSRSHATLDRVGVVATTCAKCGSVNVYVGSHKVGTISLHSSTTHHQVLKLLPTFSTRSGTVQLKVTTSGKSVAVDGLLVSRS
jgi:hypothetical protein